MLKKFKRICLLLLATAFLASGLFGCGQRAETDVQASGLVGSDFTQQSSEPEPSVQIQPGSEAQTAEAFSTEPFQLTEITYPVTEQDFETKCDGKRIIGTIFLPNNGQDIYPIVILSHGFSNVGSWLNYKAESLAASGIAALTFDFRGGSRFSRSEGATQDMTIGTETSDLMAVIDAVKLREDIDLGRIFLLGESYGGLVSARAAAQRDDIAGLILCYPALHSADVSRSFFPTVDDIPETLTSGSMVTGKAMWEELWHMDIFSDIAPYTGSVLILHGTADADVDYAYAIRAYQTYEDAQLVLIEGGDHGFLDNDDQLTVYQTLYHFVAKLAGLYGN